MCKGIFLFLLVLALQTTVLSAVSIPKNLKVTYDKDQKAVILNWDAVIENDVAGYEIFKTDAKSKRNISRYPINQSTTNFYSDKSIEPGKIYLYAIATFTYSGDKSPLTRAVKIEIPLYGSELPLRIETLKIEENTKRSAKLIWNSINDQYFDHYNIYLREEPIYNVSNIISYDKSIKNQNVNTYVIDNLMPGREYFFAITVVRKDGTENKSVNSVSFVLGIEEHFIFACDKNNKRVVKIDTKGNDTLSYLVENEPIDCEVDSKGNLYILCYRVTEDNSGDGRGWEYSLYKYPAGTNEGSMILSLPDAGFDTFIIDKDDNIWIPQYSGTLNKYSSDGQFIISVSEADGSLFTDNEGSFSGALCEGYNNESIWVGIKHDSKKTKMLELNLDGSFKRKFECSNVKTIAKFDNNNLLLSDGKFVSKYDIRGNLINHIITYVSTSDHIKDIVLDDESNIWITDNDSSGSNITEFSIHGNIVYSKKDAFNKQFNELYGITFSIEEKTVQKYLSVFPGNNYVDLIWQRSDISAFAGYKLYVSKEPFSNVEGMEAKAVIGDKNSTKFRVTGLISGKTYYFAMTIVKKDGTENKLVKCVAATLIDTVNSEEEEINNDFQHANYFDMNSSNVVVKGAIGYNGDYDYYKVTLPKSGILEVRLTNIQSSIDPVVTVYSSSFTQLSSTYNWDASNILLNSKINVSGDHYICISDKDNNNSSDQQYNLSITFYPSDQYEYNDSFDKATAISLNENSIASISLTIIPNSDVDSFKIKLPQSGILRAELYNIPGNIDPYIRVYDEKEYQLNESYNWDATDIAINTHVSKSGYYYIKVCDKDYNDWSNSPINLRISYFVSDVLEPNEYFDSASFLAFNEKNKIEIEATILPNGDGDYYYFEVPKPGMIVVNGSNFASNIDPDIRVYDNVITQLKEEYNWDGNDINYDVTLRLKGRYYILVNDKDWINWSTQPYKLKLTYYPSDDEGQGDGNFDIATELKLNSENITEVQNSINPVWDSDCYKVYISKTGTFRVYATNFNSSLDPNISIFNEKYTKLQEQYNWDGQNIDMYQKINNAGWYYVYINDRDWNNWSAQKYNLKIIFYPSDQYEPNNNLSTAEEIVLNSSNYYSLKGTLSYTGDYDDFYFQVPTSGVIRIEGLNFQSSLDPYLRVFDEKYYLLNSNYNWDANNIDLYTAVKKGGKYYFSLSDKDDNNWSAQEYNIKVTFYPGDSSEPNNNFNTATTLDLKDNYIEFTGSINNASDQDFYKVTIPKDGMFQTKLSNLNASLDPNIEIYDSQFNLINSTYNWDANNIDIYTSIKIKGIYYVKINDRDNNNWSVDPYKLELKFYPSDDNEDNDERYNATVLNLVDNKVSIKGTINELVDQDYYKVAVEKGAILHISWTNINGSLDPWLRVFDEQYNKIYDNYNWDGNNIITNVTCKTGGDYYILLDEKDENNWSAQEYDLDVSIHYSDQYEPNNSYSEAKKIEIQPNGSKELLMSINPVGDVEMFYLDLPYKGLLQVQGIGFNSSLDPYIGVYNPPEYVIASSYNWDGSDIFIDTNIKNKGKYYIYIEDKDWNNWAEDLFTLKLTYYAGDKYEINDSFDSASFVQPNITLEANILPKGDSDHFRFKASETGIATINLTNFQSSIDPAVNVYDSLKNKIGSSSNWDAENISLNVNVEKDEEYVIAIYDLDWNNYSPDKYKLEIIDLPAKKRITSIMDGIIDSYYNVRKFINRNDKEYLTHSNEFTKQCEYMTKILKEDIIKGNMQIFNSYVNNISEYSQYEIPAFYDVNESILEFMNQKDKHKSREMKDKLKTIQKINSEMEVAR